MKTLQNDFTTPEQSKRLLELGVPEWTANWKLSKLVKDSHGQKPKVKHDWEVNRKDYTHMIVGFMKYDYLPCWSVGRLIEIILKVPGFPYVGPEKCINLTNRNISKIIDLIIETIEGNLDTIDFSKLED